MVDGLAGPAAGGAAGGGGAAAVEEEASAWHFFTKLALAAPESRLPSLLTALSLQHFLMELICAAPESGLPSLLTALVAQEFWATAEPIPNKETSIAIAMMRAISSSLKEAINSVYSQLITMMGRRQGAAELVPAVGEGAKRSSCLIRAGGIWAQIPWP